MTSLPLSKDRLLVAIYTTAILVSAALLFAVQPLFAKMVLPQLGGAPSVWSVAMVFFQAMLLAGYAYAHLLTRFIPGWPSALVHIGVMVAAAFALPLAIASGWDQPPPEREALWLVGLFAASIGLPFFALSANSPLLQAWLARTPHPAAGDPYFLYAASNVGSFLALISYPLLVEPFTRLGDQARFWSVAFVILIGLIAACGAFLARSSTSAKADIPILKTAPPTRREAAAWIALAAAPSGLLIAVTAHLSTDVAAVPLMWVAPLALYLATFVFVFQSQPILRHRWMVTIEPALIVALVALIVFDLSKYLIAAIALNLAAFFVVAMVCHGELARRRPAADHLTAFYLWLSVGGMLGGLSAGLIAPNVFSWIAEYPLLIVLAILCRPGLAAPRTSLTAALWIILLALVLLIAWQPLELRLSVEQALYRGGMIVLLASSLLFWRKPLALGVIVALALVVARANDEESSQRQTIRSFFGVHKISVTGDGAYRVLLHGTTIHGAQKLENEDGDPVEGRPEPLTYYHATSPMAQAIAAARAQGGRPIRTAIIGLGTGSLACYAEPSDAWRFYEIDNTVVRFSRDQARFTFLRDCAPQSEIIIGDARLTLAAHSGEPYDVIVVDAFSSDAVPVHLLTREAMGVYLSKLAPGGLIALHVSNRHLELASVALGVAAANGLASLVNEGETSEVDDAEYKFSSTVVVAARSEDDLAALAEKEGWSKGEPDPDQWVWTDDYTNVVGAIIRKYRE